MVHGKFLCKGTGLAPLQANKVKNLSNHKQ